MLMSQQNFTALHTTVPWRMRPSLESSKHAELCMWKRLWLWGGGFGEGGGGQKSFPRWHVSQERKIDVLQGGIINNAVRSECRREQWHCVEKRWRILFSFFSQMALSINYFNVFIISDHSDDQGDFLSACDHTAPHTRLTAFSVPWDFLIWPHWSACSAPNHSPSVLLLQCRTV